MRQERRKTSEACLMSRLPLWTTRATLLGVSVKNHIEGASELAYQKVGIYLWCSNCLRVAPRGVNISTNLCLGSDFGECHKKTKMEPHGLMWTAGNAESGGRRGWDTVIMTFTEEVKPTDS